MGRLNYDSAPALGVPTQAATDSSSSVASMAAVQAVMPAGVVLPFAGPLPPDGWLLCDGSAVSRTTYAKLYAAIGTAYGTGDGSTTFDLPDLRGEFVRGLDNGRGVDAGRALGTGQDATSIAGTPNSASTSLPINNSPEDHDGLLGTSTGYIVPGAASNSGIGRYAVRPRNVAMNYIIKFA